jgi:hypothetical protein
MKNNAPACQNRMNGEITATSGVRIASSHCPAPPIESVTDEPKSWPKRNSRATGTVMNKNGT